MLDPKSDVAALPRFWKIPAIQEATPKLPSARQSASKSSVAAMNP
jgi:hypothetical protein